MNTINVTKDEREKTGWVVFTVKESILHGQAKVYNEGDGEDNPLDYNGYGVKVGSRVSKLGISSSQDGFYSAIVYNWDRGFDYHNEEALSQELLDAIIEDLDSLPRLK